MVLLILLAIAFTTFAAIVLAIFGLVEAPWPVLAVLLCLGMIMCNRLAAQIQQSGAAIATVDTEQQLASDSNHHKLVYRGHRYSQVLPETESLQGTAEPTTTKVLEGTYRGRRWQVSKPNQVSEQHPKTDLLKYRGAKVFSPKPEQQDS